MKRLHRGKYEYMGLVVQCIGYYKPDRKVVWEANNPKTGNTDYHGYSKREIKRWIERESLKIKTNKMPYTQISMSFEPITAPRKRPCRATSIEAHESVKESKEATYEKILKAYKDCEGGLTSEECAAKANISYASAHKRIPELIQQHKLYNTGETRKNKSGRSAMVRKFVIN